MKRVMFFRIASKDIHLPKLIGGFVIFAALLLFLRAGAHMFDSWDAIKSYPACAQNLIPSINEGDVVAQLQYVHCKDSLYKITGVQLRGDQVSISSRQFFAALLGPIAEFFAWAIVLVLGVIFYRTGTIVVPIEQDIREVREETKRK